MVTIQLLSPGIKICLIQEIARIYVLQGVDHKTKTFIKLPTDLKSIRRISLFKTNSEKKNKT